MFETKKKYLVSSEFDQKWGVTADTIGWSIIPPEYEHYPTPGHPKEYIFEVEKGRILDSYQLVYISSGKGVFINHERQSIEINQGDAFIITPQVWHTYYPYKKTGWKEYWIGFKGETIDHRFKETFFDSQQILYKVGCREEVVALYLRAIEIAQAEKAGHQQFLSGIVNLLLGMTMYYDKNEKFSSNGIEEQINKAKIIMRENILSNMSLEDIAGMVNMSYSWFRKTFKEYTDFTPARYIQELKLQQAKHMLISTNMSIKEIVFALNFDNTSHFSTTFKKFVKQTPQEYRKTYKVQGI